MIYQKSWQYISDLAREIFIHNECRPRDAIDSAIRFTEELDKAYEQHRRDNATTTITE